jgi:hypothetical protein
MVRHLASAGQGGGSALLHLHDSGKSNGLSLPERVLRSFVSLAACFFLHKRRAVLDDSGSRRVGRRHTRIHCRMIDCKAALCVVHCLPPVDERFKRWPANL